MIYTNWYDFKKDLEKRAGHSLPNSAWLKVKPKTCLPWTESNMKTTIAELSLLKKRENSASN